MIFGISSDTVRRIISHPVYEDYQASVKVGVSQPKQIEMSFQQDEPVVKSVIRKIVREEITKTMEMILNELKKTENNT